jgi:GDPmannose 4,6-dehydratase
MRALITGITGMDGSYLAELLLSKNYEVHGIVRRVAFEDPERRFSRIQHIKDRLTLHSASLESLPSLYRVIEKVQPTECYCLAAQSFVGVSFEDEFTTFNTNINGTHNLFYALRAIVTTCRVYFAGSSEQYGAVAHSPQTEQTPFHPRSPYGISKVAGFHLTQHYREAYGMHMSSGILYNHCSPRRGFEFVTRKITSTVAKIKYGLATELRLGNMDAKRDWGHAKDYVVAMWLMLQQETPDDYVIATGEQHSVREFAELAFAQVGLDYNDYVTVDPALYRPSDVETLLGDASKAKRILGWEPTVTLQGLVKEMVGHDLELAKRR